jgi:nitroreductase
MEFFELIHTRYSVRSYRPDPVEERLLERVIAAACLAPTASNRQPFQIIVIRTAGREADLRRIYPREWFVQPPLVISICSRPAEAWVRADGKCYADVDVAIAMDHLVLAATSLGLGTCWVAAFDTQAAREILGLPEDVEPVVFTPLGYPAEPPGIKERKPIASLVRYERW